MNVEQTKERFLDESGFTDYAMYVISGIITLVLVLNIAPIVIAAVNTTAGTSGLSTAQVTLVNLISTVFIFGLVIGSFKLSMGLFG